MQYVRNLKFEEKPDYSYCCDLIYSIADEFNFLLTDHIFDWSVKTTLDHKHGNRINTQYRGNTLI